MSASRHMLGALSLPLPLLLPLLPMVALAVSPAAQAGEPTGALPTAAPEAIKVAAKVKRPRVLYVGMDGASLVVMKALMAKGALPNISALAAAGSLRTLHSHEPTRSPAVWTTLMTGTRKEKHGIYDYVTSSWYYPEALRTKAKILSTSADRKSPALWTLLSQADKSSVVVGWLSTWPAEETKGAIVAPYIDLGNDRQTTIKGSIWKNGAPRQTFDPKLFRWLKPKLKVPANFEGEYLARFADPLPAGDALLKTLPILGRYPYTISWSGARVFNNTASTLALAKRFDPDLLAVYYQCPDSLGHRFWLARQKVEAIRERLTSIGADPARAEEIARRYGKVVDVCYAEIDAQIGKILKAVGDGFSVVVASDHGFGDCERGCAKKNVPFNGGHRNDGILLLSGPAFGSTPPKDPWVEDLPVTILKILGVPAPADVDGKVLAGSLAP